VKISSKESVSTLIDMSVGVGREAIEVGATDVNVGGTDVCVAVGREEAAVGKTSTEKVQAFSNSVVNMQPMIGRNHLRCFIASSLSAMGLLIACRWKDYKSFVIEINESASIKLF